MAKQRGRSKGSELPTLNITKLPTLNITKFPEGPRWEGDDADDIEPDDLLWEDDPEAALLDAKLYWLSHLDMLESRYRKIPLDKAAAEGFALAQFGPEEHVKIAYKMLLRNGVDPRAVYAALILPMIPTARELVLQGDPLALEPLFWIVRTDEQARELFERPLLETGTKRRLGGARGLVSRQMKAKARRDKNRQSKLTDEDRVIVSRTTLWRDRHKPG